MKKSIHAHDSGRFSGINVAATALTLAGVLLLVVAFPADAAAMQFNANVRGKVTDQDGNPLQGVLVTVEPRFQNTDNLVKPIIVETNENGEYFARNVKSGDTNLSFQLAGYDSTLIQRQLRSGPVRIDVTMSIMDAVVRANVANDSYQAAAAAFNEGRYAEVVTQLVTAIEAMEGDGNEEYLGYFYALKGQAHLRLEQLDEAVEAYRHWVNYHPGQAAPLVELGQVLSKMDDHESAAGYFEQALALNPDDAQTRFNVGQIMIGGGNLEGAIEQFARAVELQPVFPEAYVQLGYAYSRAEEYAKAVEAFEKFVEQSPDSPDVPQIQDFITALKEVIGG